MYNELIHILKDIQVKLGLQKDVFNMDDFCAYTGLSKHSAYRLTSSGRIRFFRPFGKLIFFDAEDVKAFLKQNPVDAHSGIGMKVNAYNSEGKNSTTHTQPKAKSYAR